MARVICGVSLLLIMAVLCRHSPGADAARLLTQKVEPKEPKEPNEPRVQDEKSFFSRVGMGDGGQEDVATDGGEGGDEGGDQGDRRHLLQKVDPKEPKEPSDPSAKDENAFFSRINKFSKSRSGDAGGEESDAATDDGEGEGDRRHLLQKVDPKEPKEPSDPSVKDENAFFSRINKFSNSRGGDAGGEESDAATDDGEGNGDRRHLLQKVDPKEPKEPSDPSAKDENAFFIRINKFSKSRGGDAGGEESDAATDDGEGEGDRRH